MSLAADWPRVPVESVCEVVVDCVNRTAPVVDQETPYRMIRTTNIRHGRIDLTETKYVDRGTYERWTRRLVPQRDDVLLTREAPLGEVALLRSDEPVFLGQRIMHYRADRSRMDPRFLAYAMMSHEVQSRIHGAGSGSTVAHMRVEDAKTFLVPRPELPVQERIADVLAAYDELFEANLRRSALLEESVHLVYREWFDRLRFPGHEWSARADGLPDGWVRGTIADIADLEREAIVPDRAPNEEFDHYSFPAYDEGEFPAVERGDTIKSMKYLVTAGTVLVPKLNPHIPRVWVPAPTEARRAIASSEYLVLRPKAPATQAYLAAFCGRRDFLSMLAGRADGTSTSHRRVKPGDFMAQPCLIPSEAVLAQFDERVAPMLALRQTLKLQSRKAREARAYLLPRLMSGQLTA